MRLPFSLLLPLLALSLWVAVVAVPMTPLYFQLREEAKTATDKTVTVGDFQYTIPAANYVSYAMGQALEKRSPWLTAINLPGMVGEVLTSLPGTWPESWHPENLELEQWRVLIFTFYCLPFWWLAGLGLDAALGRRRPHWVVLLLGTLLFAGFAVLLGGLAVMKPGDSSDGNWPLWGLGLWVVLFVPMPVAWVRGRTVSS